MRWILPKRPPGPKEGDKKTETKFLILPLTLENKDGYRERRWCETTTMELEWCSRPTLEEGGGTYYDWVPKKWVD